MHERVEAADRRAEADRWVPWRLGGLSSARFAVDGVVGPPSDDVACTRIARRLDCSTSGPEEREDALVVGHKVGDYRKAQSPLQRSPGASGRR